MTSGGRSDGAAALRAGERSRRPFGKHLGALALLAVAVALPAGAAHAAGDAPIVDSNGDLPLMPFVQPMIDPTPKSIPVPDGVTEADAYSAFQRGYFLTAFAYATKVASEKHDAEAMTLIAYLYANGLGLPLRPDEAAKWYGLAADAGDPVAMVELANIYANGQGVDADIGKSKALLEKAKAAGSTEADYYLGVIALNGDTSDPTNAKGAFDDFKAAADRGQADAAYALATLYQEGIGVAADPKQAAYWMGQAAVEGNASAAVEYAIMLYNGNGIASNPPVAAQWFERSARLGNPIAQNRLARLYTVGSGVPKDLRRAAFWHELATKGGITDAWLDRELKAELPGDFQGAPPDAPINGPGPGSDAGPDGASASGTTAGSGGAPAAPAQN